MAEAGNEEWRDIAGFEGLYMISSHGNARSIPRVVERSGSTMRIPGGALDLNANRGYRRINLRKNGKTFQRFIHQLVAEAFIGERKTGQDTRHLDGNSLNNRVENLAYGSRSDNVQDAIRTKGIKTGSKSPNAKLTDEDVERILEGSETALELAKALGVGQGHIAGIRSGRSWAHESLERKGSYKKVGTKHPQAKITEEDVKKVLSSSESNRAIARKLGVDKAVIARIRNGSAWKHVQRPELARLNPAATSQDPMIGSAAE